MKVSVKFAKVLHLFVALIKAIQTHIVQITAIGQDKEAMKLHSYIMKNRTEEQKAETRRKQIETWTNSMGENWSHIMAVRACESYDKSHNTIGGPFGDPNVRKKCEESWGDVSSPSCLKETKDKISETVHNLWINDDEYSEKFRESWYKNTLTKYQQINPNILDYDGEKFTYKCPVCGEITYFGLQFLCRRLKWNIDLCSNCVPRAGISNLEKNMLNYIKEIYSGEIIENDKNVIKPKELDIVLPELKLAFEFDGTYWHADSRIFDENDVISQKQMTAQEIWEYDNNKVLLAESKGIKLIRIKELDWVNDNINTKMFIKNLIEVNKC